MAATLSIIDAGDRDFGFRIDSVPKQEMLNGTSHEFSITEMTF